MSYLSTSVLPRPLSRTRPGSQPVRRRPEVERREHGDGGESDVRHELVRRARERIASGYYDHPLVADQIADKLASLLTEA